MGERAYARAGVVGTQKNRDQKNSPSRLRFRPPNRLTFRFRVRPLGSASTYLRSVVGAEGNLVDAKVSVQVRPQEKTRSLRGLATQALRTVSAAGRRAL